MLGRVQASKLLISCQAASVAKAGTMLAVLMLMSVSQLSSIMHSCDLGLLFAILTELGVARQCGRDS